jgi:hypothetical protein
MLDCVLVDRLEELPDCRLDAVLVPALDVDADPWLDTVLDPMTICTLEELPDCTLDAVPICVLDTVLPTLDAEAGPYLESANCWGAV